MQRILIIIFSWLALCVPVNSAEIFAQTESSGGWTWLFVVGRIEIGDDVKFKNELISAAKNGNPIYTVAVYSPGGAVEPAIKIGRYIRTMRIATIAPYSFRGLGNQQICPFTNNKILKFNRRTRQGNPKCICASACFLIWASGVGADVHNSNVQPRIQIHRIAFNKIEYANMSEEEARTKYESEQRDVEAYLKEMDVPDSVIRRMFSIPSKTVSYLTTKELAMMRGALPPYLGELYDAKCGQNQRCRDNLERKLYFKALPILEAMD